MTTPPKRRIGIDVSGMTLSKHVTGIERVLIEINQGLTSLVDSNEFEIYPFVTLPEFKKPEPTPDFLTKDPIFSKPLQPIGSFDILFFGGININLPMPELIRLKRDQNQKVVTLVHDILPITHPEWFATPKFANGREAALTSRGFFQIYLQSTFSLSDHLILTSQHVKNEIASYKWNHLPETSVLQLGAFEVPPTVTKIPHSGIKTLYVSTVTIRKGHAELLSAFDLLWGQGLDISLTIVGNRGWLIDDFIERMRTHAEFGARLFWRERLSDLEIYELYQQSDISFIASEDEGFGLVLEEGVANGVKVIARDIPVFRERSYPNLYFFSGGPKELSEKILEVAPIPVEPLPEGSIRTLKDFVNDLVQIFKMI
jgi:glycosyltransferase involved in cell wall biosynthesis